MKKGDESMATHVVMWNFKSEVRSEDKPALLAAMQEHLESLAGRIPGLESVRFITAPLAGTTHEMALVTTHKRAADIAVYAAHPAHVAVADTYVRPYTCDRACLNF